MKKIMIVSALVIAMTGISTAQADNQWQGGGDRGGQGDHRGPQQGQDNRGGGKSQWQDNRGGNPQWQGQRFRAPNQYYRPHGYQVRSWRGGDRLPPSYRGRRYYVDYRQYHLNPPPYGYQWVRVDNDVVLAAVTTGVIMSVVQGLYY